MTAVQTRGRGALSALGSLGGFRRRVVRSGGAVHRPDAEPRLARFRAIESGAAPANLFPATSAFWICDSSQNRQRGFGATSLHRAQSQGRGIRAESNQ